MRYSIVINGIGHAFLREFGCSCDRCTQREHVANTSVSIIAADNKTREVVWHALVDVGLGVVTSLCNLVKPENARLDWLLFTHWHPDHSLELNRLCETLRRTARLRSQPYSPISTWCRNGTAQWLKKTYSYEWRRCLDPYRDEGCEPPGQVLDPIQTGTAGLKITPISVSHCTADIDPVNLKDRFFSSASFVVETDQKKAILLWDIDNTNDWIVNPASEEQEKTVALLSEADYVFIDCFNWTVEQIRGYNTGHISFSTVRQYMKALQPRETLLMHISGHEEGLGNPGWGWLDRRWEREAQKIWQEESIPGVVRVPRIGEEFALLST